MRGHRWLTAAGLALLASLTLGCHGTGSTRVSSAPEPSLSGAIDNNTAVAETNTPKTVSYVDRHPLLSKPRDYWDSAGNNTIVKAGAATFIGVPVGIYGEIKQIVVGTPPQTR
ncbi:MAG: hypothetical protein ACLP7Q_03535 [Isosphaeraceae bacterium]